MQLATTAIDYSCAWRPHQGLLTRRRRRRRQTLQEWPTGQLASCSSFSGCSEIAVAVRPSQDQFPAVSIWSLESLARINMNACLSWPSHMTVCEAIGPAKDPDNLHPLGMGCGRRRWQQRTETKAGLGPEANLHGEGGLLREALWLQVALINMTWTLANPCPPNTAMWIHFKASKYFLSSFVQ